MTRTKEIKSETQTTVVAGELASYRTAGAGAPMVLLHAFPLSSGQWRPQLAAPPAGVRLLAPDFRGFRGPDGKAAAGDTVPAAMTVADYAADILALMDVLEIPSAGVCGVSMGGYVALGMLRLAPRRITRLILANTRATSDTPAAREARDKAIALVRGEGVPAIGREMLPKLLGETTRRDHPGIVHEVRGLIEANSPDAVVAALEALKSRPDSRVLLGDIACETTIVHGAEDTIIPAAEAEAMHAAISGSRLVVIPGAGHLSNLEAPAIFTALLGART